MNIKEKFALLTRLPLMQGIGGKELAAIEARIGLEVESYPHTKAPIIEQGELCTQLIFLAEGRIMRRHRIEGTDITAVSILEAPCVLEAENIFGLKPRYECTYLLVENAGLICVPKSEINSLLMKNDIFRLNMMNHLSAICQREKAVRQACMQTDTRSKVEEALRCWFRDTDGKGEVEYKMTDLATYIGETRLNTSRVLNTMEEEGILELKRGKIILK